MINWTILSRQGATLREDGKIFWLVDCTFDIGRWIEIHDKAEWEVSGPYYRSKYLISEELILLLALAHPRRDIINDQFL